MRLVEQDPKHVAGQRTLAELALEAGDFDTAALAAVEAYALAPADPTVRALKATVDFRKGGEARDRPRWRWRRRWSPRSPARCRRRWCWSPTGWPPARRPRRWREIDEALAHTPGDEGLHLARLATLDVLGDAAGVGAELARMAALFPENAAVRAALVQWHLERGRRRRRRGGAARGAAGAGDAPAATSDPGPALTLVRFLNEVRGPAAARAELDRLVAAAADPAPYARARAALDFAAGDTDAAIAAMRGLVADAEPSDATRDLETGLAGMLAETGDGDAAAAIVEAVLAADRDHVAALKLRAKLALDADRPEAAVQDMRTALAQAPRDAEALTVMALAYERQGARELAGEQLARAVEASDRAPAESLRYAAFLMQDDRTGPAEAVLVDALRRAPEDPELLATLGEIHLARRDWARAGQVAALLARLGRPGGGGDGGRARGGAPRRARAAPTRPWRCSRSSPATAATPARWRRWCAPASRPATRPAPAPGSPACWPTTPATRRRGCCSPGSTPRRATRPPPRPATGRWSPTRRASPPATGPGPASSRRPGAAPRRRRRSTPGSTRSPGDADLMFARAGLAEAAGDREGAIALYEALYARDPGAPVVANNLASLIATTRPDPESLDARLRHRPAAARLGRAAVPGHLRLDPAPARRPGPGARLPRPGRRGDARQRRGAVPPRRGRVRARALRRGAGELRPGAGGGGRRQPAARGGDRPQPARRDRRPARRRRARGAGPMPEITE